MQATRANTVATGVPATAAQAGSSPTHAATPAPAASGATSPATPPRPQTATSPPAAAAPTTTLPARCDPTAADGLGPFSKPNAPRRTSFGQGYVLAGVVRSADGCAPIPGTLVEFWLANPHGEYDDHRATMQAGAQGDYRFESNVPAAYGGRPPHIHVKVTAPGFRELVTQHYPQPGQTEASYDLVLSPQ